MQNAQEYSTRDVCLAATLEVLGHPIVRVDIEYATNGKVTGYFVLARTPELLQVESQFWPRHLSVEPRAYQAAVRSLKSRVKKAEEDLQDNS